MYFENETASMDCSLILPNYVSLSSGTNALDVKGKSCLVVDNTTLLGLNIGGFSGGRNGQVLIIKNRSANVLSILNFLNGAGAAAPENRIFPNNLVDLPLSINQTKTFHYENDGGRLGWYQLGN